MATCAAGHVSDTADYCDTCGLPMGAAPVTAPLPASPQAAAGPPPVCAACGAARTGRFCEECGHDADLPAEAGPSASPPPTSTVWTAVVRADRAWFDEVRRRDGPDAADLEFPRFCPERRFVLTGSQVAIGRRSRSRGTDPEIDLSGPPLDPGVSAQHALLLARSDGHWELVDIGSTNGTAVGDTPEPIPAHVPVVLADGERIRLGAWTTITIGTAGTGDERDQSR